MRVHVISDIEGVAGVVKSEQGDGGESLFEEARRLYTEEINAAMRGACAAGATEVVVMDCHGAGKGWTSTPCCRRPSTRAANGSSRANGRSTRASSRRAATRRSSSGCTRGRASPTAS